MAKKNLKSALAGHNQRKAIKEHQAKVDAALARKNDSIKAKGQNKSNNKKRKIEEDETDLIEVESSIASQSHRPRSVNPFLKDDTILLVGEGESRIGIRSLT